MCDLVDLFISPLNFLGSRYVEFGIPQEQITVSDYGFDLSAWKTAPPKSTAPAERLPVGQRKADRLSEIILLLAQRPLAITNVQACAI